MRLQEKVQRSMVETGATVAKATELTNNIDQPVQEQQAEQNLEERINEVNQELAEKKIQAEAEIEQEKLEAKAEEEYEHIKDVAQKIAERTVSQAKAQADLIIKQAELQKEASGGCCSGCANNPCGDKPKPAYEEAALLVPLQPEAEKDFKSLGLDKDLSVRNDDLANGVKVAQDADEEHKAIRLKHENDCKGPICPMMGSVVSAEEK